jgi:hypothetical protein
MSSTSSPAATNRSSLTAQPSTHAGGHSETKMSSTATQSRASRSTTAQPSETALSSLSLGAMDGASAPPPARPLLARSAIARSRLIVVTNATAPYLARELPRSTGGPRRADAQHHQQEDAKLHGADAR